MTRWIARGIIARTQPGGMRKNMFEESEIERLKRDSFLDDEVVARGAMQQLAEMHAEEERPMCPDCGRRRMSKDASFCTVCLERRERQREHKRNWWNKHGADLRRAAIARGEPRQRTPAAQRPAAGHPWKQRTRGTAKAPGVSPGTIASRRQGAPGRPDEGGVPRPTPRPRNSADPAFAPSPRRAHAGANWPKVSRGSMRVLGSLRRYAQVRRGFVAIAGLA